MNRLLDQLKSNPMTLIVSLPENSLELALAAADNGAQALKVHCGITHKASGVHFGTLDEEKAKLAAILNRVSIPVGIVPGEETPPTREEMDEIVKMGFDFFDMYLDKMPDYMLNMEGINIAGAINGKFPLDDLIELSVKNLDIIEAAIIPQMGYGQNLTIGDLQYYITITTAVSLPVIIPTQRKILPEEVPIISDAGLKGLMIGAIVTGKTPDSIAKATREFREAVDDL